MHDVAIIGGGPSGLSAALVLGRCRRRTIVLDNGKPRNARSRALHGFLTRDGISPREFLQIARLQLRRYPSVEFCATEVSAISKTGEGFKIRTNGTEVFESRVVLMATGLVDELPKLRNIERFFGRSVHHCPYCDGWEHRDQSIVVFGMGVPAAELAIELRQWSREITLCLQDSANLPDGVRRRMTRAGLRVRHEPIVSLEGKEDQLEQITFASGEPLNCSALFFISKEHQRCDLATNLGCTLTEEGLIHCPQGKMAAAEGVFAVGNATPGRQLVIIAAAEGTEAALEINEWLQEKEFGGG